MSLDDQFSHVAAQWHRAALEPGHFTTAITRTAALMGAQSAMLFTFLPDTQGRSMFVGHGGINEVMDVYSRHWIHEDPWFRALSAKRIVQPAGSVSLGRQLVPNDELFKTGFYNDLAKPAGIHDVMGLVVCAPDDPQAPATRLSMYRAYGAGEHGSTEWRLMQNLWPTIQRAVKSHWMLQGVQEVRRAIEETLDGVRHPVIVLRDDGRVDFMNAAAAALHRSWLQLSHQRLVRIGQVDLAATGPGSVAELAARGTPVIVDNVVAERYRRGTAQFTSIRDLPAYATTWPQASTLLVLDLEDPALDHAWFHIFAEHYRLTPAEQRVLLHIVRGEDLPWVAQQLGVSYATVRTQVQSLLRKTGTTRQTQLVGMVLGRQGPAQAAASGG